MLERERNVVRPDLEHRRSARRAVGHIAKARVEETRVVGPELASRRVIGGHLGREVRWDPDAFPRYKEIELTGPEDELPARRFDALPVVADFVGVLEVEVEEPGALLGSISDEGPPSEVDAQEKSVRDDGAVAGLRGRTWIDDRVAFAELEQLGV